MILTYIIAKIIDTIYWAQVTAPDGGFTIGQFYHHNGFYGYWILFVEIVVGGVAPALILITEKGRSNHTGLRRHLHKSLGHGVAGHGRTGHAF